jgi:RimJ/RimL family protein N-acetyltransferase
MTTTNTSDEVIGLMHTWWRGDPLPRLSPIPGLTIAPSDDLQVLTELTNLEEDEIGDRFATGNRVWVARLGDDLVGYGWMATRGAVIDQLGLTLNLGPSERYLWDFVTFPEWRGRGIYPRIMQQMIASDDEVTRLWIGHDVPNVASRHGIAKAGFLFCGALFQSLESGYRFVSSGAARERAVVAADVLGVPFDPTTPPCG